MRLARSLTIFLLVVFLGAALLSPWLHKAVQQLGQQVPALSSLANQPFHRFVTRSLLVLALVSLWPLVKAMGLRSKKDLGIVPLAGNGDNLRKGFLIGFGMLALAIGFTIFSVLRYRKNNGGYMTLKEGFMVTFFTLAIAGLITGIVTIILYTVIDPEYPKQIAEKTIEKTTEMMQKFGASDADIEKAMERQGDMSEKFTAGGQIRSYLFGLIVYAVYAVILGAIFKKRKPPFEESVN